MFQISEVNVRLNQIHMWLGIDIKVVFNTWRTRQARNQKGRRWPTIKVMLFNFPFSK